MASPVEDALNDLKTKILTVTAVKKKVISVYDQNDLIDMQKDYGFPAIGIMYASMRAHGETEKKQAKIGGSATITIDLLVVGAEQCSDKVVDHKASTLELLHDLRGVILCTKFERTTGGAGRHWAFVEEAPVNIDENLIGYVQRWQTVVILTNG